MSLNPRSLAASILAWICGSSVDGPSTISSAILWRLAQHAMAFLARGSAAALKRFGPRHDLPNHWHDEGSRALPSVNRGSCAWVATSSPEGVENGEHP